MLTVIAWIFILSSICIAIYVYYNTRRHPEAMKIMNLVWVLTALWGSFGALFLYRKWSNRNPMTAARHMDMASMSRQDTTMPDPIQKTNNPTSSTAASMPMKHDAMMSSMPEMDMTSNDSTTNPSAKMTADMNMDRAMPHARTSIWRSVALSALHCGAGCVLADLVGEGITYFFPLAVGGSLIAGSWTLDFVLALFFGVFFQYMAMKQMQPSMHWKQLVGKAAKADILSLTAWQVGMYGWMAICYFVIFPYGTLHKDSATFWFMMQIAMLAGFCTALPVNYLLIKFGIKKAM